MWKPTATIPSTWMAMRNKKELKMQNIRILSTDKMKFKILNENKI